MDRNGFRYKTQSLLSQADVKLGSARPWDIQVHNERFYASVLANGSLGLGESYVDRWWDCQRIDQLCDRLLRAQLEGKIKPRVGFFEILKAKLFNLQKLSRAFRIAQQHYDIGNDLYRRMLDPRLIYSCGYWKNASTLDQAQQAKLDLVCQKIHLKPGMRVLDIGCGWGGTAKYAAQRYGVEVLGVTVSQQQVTLGKELSRGLPVEIRLQD